MALVSYPLKNGGTIFVEVPDDPPAPGIAKAGTAGDDIEQAANTFEDAIDSIKPAAEAILSAMKELSPDSVEVSFGLKCSVKTGIPIVISSGIEANFDVKLTWGSGK